MSDQITHRESWLDGWEASRTDGIKDPRAEAEEAWRIAFGDSPGAALAAREDWIAERSNVEKERDELRAKLAAREGTERPEEEHEEMLDLLEEAIWAVGVNPLAGKIQAILLKYGR